MEPYCELQLQLQHRVQQRRQCAQRHSHVRTARNVLCARDRTTCTRAGTTASQYCSTGMPSTVQCSRRRSVVQTLEEEAQRHVRREEAEQRERAARQVAGVERERMRQDGARRVHERREHYVLEHCSATSERSLSLLIHTRSYQQ